MSSPLNRPLLQLASSLGSLALALFLMTAGSIAVFSQGSTIQIDEKVIESAERKYGAIARKRLEQWQELLSTGRDKPEAEKLKLVNSFFNRIIWVSDPEHWKKADYWATPLEMLATNGGDCEDFAIAKYFTLVAIGVPDEKLKITYVKTRDPNPINQSHMVLAYYNTPSAVPLILDNIIPEIKTGAQRGAGKQVEGGSSNIAFWRELTARMGKEFI